MLNRQYLRFMQNDCSNILRKSAVNLTFAQKARDDKIHKNLLKCVKIHKIRGRECVPVAYIIAIPSGLVPRSSFAFLFVSPVSCLVSTLPPGESLFRALSTHNRAFACKLDITT